MVKACRKGRYKKIEAVAAVVSGLRRRGEVGVSVRLVDSVAEELRWALEHPNIRDQQRTKTYARLLGIFCRSQVSGRLVMDQLYEFINLGHETPIGLREASMTMADSAAGESAELPSEPRMPEYNSSGAVGQKTIAEDGRRKTRNWNSSNFVRSYSQSIFRSIPSTTRVSPQMSTRLTLLTGLNLFALCPRLPHATW
jgi:regulator of nonsense transcripts 2